MISAKNQAISEHLHQKDINGFDKKHRVALTFDGKKLYEFYQSYLQTIDKYFIDNRDLVITLSDEKVTQEYNDYLETLRKGTVDESKIELKKNTPMAHLNDQYIKYVLRNLL